MKVAIIGAGLAGLYCAYELERLGIKPDVYEKNSFIGEAINHVIGVVNITHRPVPDIVKFMSRNHHIDIQPLTTINVLEHHGPKVTTTLSGTFGYFFKLSKDADSLKNQIYGKLRKTRFHLSEVGDYIELSKKYDYVVVASGNSGYAYMTPFDRHRASIAIITTDVNEKEIDKYWELFLYGESIKNPIVEEFTLVHNSGYVYPRQFNNIIFTGNAAGGVEPFLGFGHFNASVMAVSAARTIALGWSYERQIQSIIKRNDEMRRFRMMFNTLSNNQYDMLMLGLRFPGVKQLLYSTNINVSKYGAIAGRLFSAKSGR